MLCTGKGHTDVRADEVRRVAAGAAILDLRVPCQGHHRRGPAGTVEGKEEVAQRTARTMPLRKVPRHPKGATEGIRHVNHDGGRQLPGSRILHKSAVRRGNTVPTQDEDQEGTPPRRLPVQAAEKTDTSNYPAHRKQ